MDNNKTRLRKLDTFEFRFERSTAHVNYFVADGGARLSLPREGWFNFWPEPTDVFQVTISEVEPTYRCEICGQVPAGRDGYGYGPPGMEAVPLRQRPKLLVRWRCDAHWPAGGEAELLRTWSAVADEASSSVA
jgi:hypothetical protein